MKQRSCVLLVVLAASNCGQVGTTHSNTPTVASDSVPLKTQASPPLAHSKPHQSSADSRAVQPAKILASARLEKDVAYIDVEYPNANAPSSLRLTEATAVQAIQVVDLEAEPISFEPPMAAGQLQIAATARFAAVLVKVQRKGQGPGYPVFAIVSLKDQQPKVIFAESDFGEIQFRKGKTTVLDIVTVQYPTIPPGYQGMPPHPRYSTYVFDGNNYINSSNLAGVTAGPAIHW